MVRFLCTLCKADVALTRISCCCYNAHQANNFVPRPCFSAQGETDANICSCTEHPPWLMWVNCKFSRPLSVGPKASLSSGRDAFHHAYFLWKQPPKILKWKKKCTDYSSIITVIIIFVIIKCFHLCYQRGVTAPKCYSTSCWSPPWVSTFWRAVKNNQPKISE